MVRHCLFLYFLGVSICFLAGTVAHNAIVGGYEAEVGQFPYHVTLMIRDEDVCGGCIIGNYFVLTAAHCVSFNSEFPDRRHLTIVAGTSNLKQRRYPALTIKVNKIFVPKQFTGVADTTNGDIAVLKLKRSLKLSTNKHLQKLELPVDKNETYVAKTATITGFGWDWVHVYKQNESLLYGGKTSSKLIYAEAHITTHSECQKGYSEDNVTISENEMCARIKLNRENDLDRYGACVGDSGGPLVYNRTTVIGILSKGSPGCSEKEKATIYTRISDYLDFIKTAMHK